MINNKEKLRESINKEIQKINKSEMKLQKSAAAETPKYKETLKSKIPPKILTTLEKAFFKAFELIFEKGIGIIEKGYNKEDIDQDFSIQDYAINLKCNRKELKKLNKNAKKKNFKNLSVTAVEGVGLGALGIGLPDIVLFIGMVLKGIYEVSLHYGYNYDSDSEKYLILKLMYASLYKGSDWDNENREIDRLLTSPALVDIDTVKMQTEETSKMLAMDMLVLKFIQGLPIVGIIGGAFNPVYYNKILNYVRLKYYKRYLLEKLQEIETQ
ncbi:MAG: EcsC family protein [Clostridia bacterium]|nr:EcsC family protein [Clostridia bacterium]